MSPTQHSDEISNDEELLITPANRASTEDLRALFGTRGPAARCQCQRYRLRPGESFGKQPVEERRHRLAEQTGCGDPDTPTSGLVAWLDSTPVGWCAVGPRSDLVGLVRVFTVPWKDRQEDRADASIWAVTCVFVAVGYRRRGIGSALVRATVPHAGAAGARAVEGYPINTTDVISEELHVGTAAMFADAGFRPVSEPTPRRVVMRREL